jgi:curli biogenesis system outer membrane secretion channel CsgG
MGRRQMAVLSVMALVLILWGCQTPQPTAKVTSGGSQTIAEAQAESYNGPKARVAVAQFKDKTGKGWWTGEIGDGMCDMLATALFNTNRYIVLERQILGDVMTEQDLGASGRVRQDTAAPIGQMEGAELLITGAVTEFEPGASGGGGGIGGWGGGVAGGILGGINKAHLAIDMRVVDTRTSRVVAATSVEGEATDFNLGGVLVGSHVGGGLGGYSKTPMEKAVRVALGEAVNFIVSKTPANYYHIGGSGGSVPPAPKPAAASVPSSTQENYVAFASPRTISVTSPTANIRSDASTTASVAGTARKGDTLNALGMKGSWYHVELPNGKEGYVFKNLVAEQ